MKNTLCLITMLVIAYSLMGMNDQQPVAAIGQTDFYAVDSSGDSATDSTRNVALLSYLPGYPTGAIQVKGDLVYAGMGHELVVFNMAQPATPILLGHLTVPGLSPNLQPPAPIVLADHYVFVADTYTIYAIDVSDPTHLRQVGSLAFDGNIGALAVVDQRLLVGSDMRLWVVDIADPISMKKSGYLNAAWYITSISVEGTVAYVIANGLNVIDISAAVGPNPVLRARLTLNSGVKVLTTATRAYILNGFMYQSVTTVDITTPTAPVELGTYYHKTSVGGTLLFGDAAVSNEQLFIVEGEALQIIDFSNPAAPQKIMTLPLPSPRAIRNVYIAGKRIYVTGEDLIVFDISTPGDLVRVGAYMTTFYEANDILAQDQYVYVADTFGLSVLDVMTPTMPLRVGYVTAPAVGNLYELASTENMLYAAGASYLYAVDIANPTVPQVTGVYTDQGSASLYNVAAVGNLVFVPETGTEQNSLVLLDATNPAMLQPIGRQPLPNRPVDIAAASHYVYVADGSSLQVIDVNNPTSPVLTGVYSDPMQYIGKLTLAGHNAYIQNSSQRINIVDVANPARPTWIGSYQYPASWLTQTFAWGETVDLAVDGQYAYLTDAFRGLLILDISNPAAAFEVGRYYSPTTRNLSVSNNHAFVAQNQSGVSIVAFQPPVTTTTVDSNGGMLLAKQDDVTYTFAAHVFSVPTILTHTTRYLDNRTNPFNGLVDIQHSFMVTATQASTMSSIQPLQPYTIEIHYTQEQLGPAIESTVALYRWDGTQWQQESTSTLDTLHNRLRASPNHFAFWAVFGQTNKYYLPIIGRGNPTS